MESLISIASDFNIWVVVKFFTIVLLGMYMIFALVIVRQVKMMTDTLQLGFEGPAKLFSYAHLVFAAFVLLSALTIL